MNTFIETITSENEEVRNTSFFRLASNIPTRQLYSELQELDEFRKLTQNLYQRVRACIFLYAGYRFFLMKSEESNSIVNIPIDGYNNLLKRNFEKAISIFRLNVDVNNFNPNIFSCLAESYHLLTFQILADQVRKSVRSSKGNQWMFRVGHFDQHPLKIHPQMLFRTDGQELFPILNEKTSVRMDLTHSCWSDIFFLGMDYPEGARVINVSVDLGVYGRDNDILPPLESYVRIITEPVIRVTSLDLKDTKDISELSDLFNFGNDYLSLLKAAVVASGFIPPSFEGTRHSIKDLLGAIIGPGMGIELVTKVNDIPKGSRLAVSTNLLASMISALMRATQQTQSFTGLLTEQERRLIASRAILGEWIGGSGGGWQDSGGIWPGIKAIEGALATMDDPEFKVSRGCLLPKHRVLVNEYIHPQFQERIADSLVLFHGGMASNVGPVLEMVTEKYLLRSENEWIARQEANQFYNEITTILKEGDIQKLAELTSKNFHGPIKTIIPWATTHFTETIINKAKAILGSDYWGFLMLGGISGGGMGMFVNPAVHSKAKDIILTILEETKREMSTSLPFAMNPVVYNFKINNKGSEASLLNADKSFMPYPYYALHLPLLVKTNTEILPEIKKIEIDRVTALSTNGNDSYTMLRSVVANLFRHSVNLESLERKKQNEETEKIKHENGFDYIQHEQIRQDFTKGRIGLARNRLSAETIIENVSNSEIADFNNLGESKDTGLTSIKNNEVAVMCLAAGLGSRWTKGAGVIKSINPFVEIKGKHRSFLEIHLSKNSKTGNDLNGKIPFIIATSYLTHKPIESTLLLADNYKYFSPIYLSPGKSIGQRFIPFERDLRFLWEEMPQERLDENKQKVRDSLREALIAWAKSKGEGSDYVDNISSQRLNPLGHWYEVANMLRNGVLARLITDNPSVKHIMLHNLDTLGATVSPEILGFHIDSGNALTFEVISRRFEDKGGGLAKVNGKIRMLEGLAQPHEEDELGLSFYNSMTTWINIDQLLKLFGFSRASFLQATDDNLSEAVRHIARRMPSYTTIKEVKYRWGHGQEDIYPVAQIEKLWSDMSTLSDLQCGYVVVPRLRGQQLKDPAQLDSWVQDGSKSYLESICSF